MYVILIPLEVSGTHKIIRFKTIKLKCILITYHQYQ